MNRRLFFSGYLILLLMLSTPAISLETTIEGSAVVAESQLSFAEARDNLVFAIEGRGLVLSYVSHASDMLSRTAEAVGVSESVYDQAEVLLFCKSDLSHALVAANPHDLVLCPYAIAVYTLAEKPDQAYFAFRNPEGTGEFYQPVTELLLELIEEAINFF